MEAPLTRFSASQLDLTQHFSPGFASCDEPDWTMLLSRPADMYSAALLLMLAVRICADGVERPTGKQTGGRKTRGKSQSSQ
ncbi:hypothetical protein XENOCAPTIV_009014 [Xenoophorus captivus]|uniref:Uncharacterized protein n=1 Tax=Xenoophorus captivus TaxID=1517983 RepID=A0ABV0S688_9TELE